MPTGEIQFGPFRLSPGERLLAKDGAPISIGGRALDILITLTRRPGETITKKDLLDQVWPGVSVDEGSLRFNIAALRKILGDGQGGARYVTNVAGRGYCFVAPVSQASSAPQITVQRDDSRRFPSPLRRMIGRDGAVRTISDNLRAERFVTVVGAGGIGKTTVAVAIGNALLQEFDGEVLFVDLGALNDPQLVPSALSSMLGVMAHPSDPTSSLVAFLRDKRLLLVLDSCEHVIETAASLAETIFAESAEVHILATSREPLKVEGEHVHRLLPLDCPPQDGELTAKHALSFPAARLFVERITASSSQFELIDTDAPLVAEICHKLDGMALAIELAAGRVGTFGLQQTAALLDNRLRLLSQGRRTALPRHQTLDATLDWSFDLLDERERAALRRLSVFVGTFRLDAAQDVVAGNDLDDADVLEILASLIDKSLAVADTGEAATRYRLLDTTRAYARQKLLDSGEYHEMERRHARFYAAFMDGLMASAGWLSKGERVHLFSEHLGNVRAALEYSFSPRGEVPVAIALAAASALLFIELSLLNECRNWCQRALSAIGDAESGTTDELELQASLGMSLMFTQGNGEDVRKAFTRGLALAKELAQPYQEMRLLSGFQIYLTRISDFNGALALAEQSRLVAAGIADPAGALMANWMVGVTQHLIGQQESAWQNCSSALTHGDTSRWISLTRLGYDHRIIALVAAARALWLRGYPDQAVKAARYTLDEAGKLDYPLTLGIALVWSAYVFFWVGDHESASEITERLIVHTAKYSLGPYHAVGLGLRGEVLVQHGKFDEGIALLEQSLDRLRADRHQILDAAFVSDLAQALALAGQPDRASETIALAIETVGDNTSFHVPEMLRIKGDILAGQIVPDLKQAESYCKGRWNWPGSNQPCPGNSERLPRSCAYGGAWACSNRPMICFGRFTTVSPRASKPLTSRRPGCCSTNVTDQPRDSRSFCAGCSEQSNAYFVEPP
jgi:predicted ATPase/DNA-binding winged helix-turn-helix (wHTH) protein